MRPGDAMFRGQEGLPTWAVTLVRELISGAKEAPSRLLTPITALDELTATTTSVIRGRGHIYEPDRRSLAQDVSASLKNLGSSTQRATGAVLRAFQKDDLGKLHQFIADVDGARRLRTAANSLIAELLLPRVSRAAWDDIVEAFKEDTSPGTCVLRIAQLVEITIRRGQSWEAVQRRLMGVLTDQLTDIAEVRGADVDYGSSSEDFDAKAGLSLEQRLELCRTVVADAPAEEQSIVWMVYGNAALRTSFIRKGPVQFFDGALGWTNIRDGCPALNRPDFEPPDELQDPVSERFFGESPAEPFVYVRVEVDSRHVADVRRFARDLVWGLVEIADRDTAWLLFDGEAIFIGGHWWGSAHFTDPRLWVRNDNPHRVLTSRLLENLDPGVAERLASGDERSAAALQQRRWERAVAAADDPAQRLTLAMRTLEEALPSPRTARGSVRESCERYLMETWSMGTLHDQLRDAAYYGTAFGFSTDRERMLLRDAIVPGDDESFTFQPAVFMKRIAEVLAGLDKLTIEHRMVREASDWVSTGEAMASHIDELDRRFRRLLARAIRQRNAVVHGAQAVPGVIATCEPFIFELCGQVVAHALTAAGKGEDLVDWLEAERAAWLRQRAALHEGKQPAAILFAGKLAED